MGNPYPLIFTIKFYTEMCYKVERKKQKQICERFIVSALLLKVKNKTFFTLKTFLTFNSRAPTRIISKTFCLF